ncbi:angiotensin-converting enzyme-like [Diadema antillarum]|uniref:angiotensin-converting enzyme-like n=1 Tax=Diadema antillarum TaxID=105358 RepID=UPI003A8BB9C4
MTSSRKVSTILYLSAVLMALLGTHVQSYEDIDLHRLQLIAKETSGLLRKLACTDAQGRKCETCIPCIEYDLGDTVKDKAIVSDWLNILNISVAEMLNMDEKAAWNHLTNITAYNTEISAQVGKLTTDYQLGLVKEASRIAPESLDHDQQRILHLMLQDGTKVDPAKVSALHNVESQMQNAFGVAKVCRSSPASSHGKSTEECLSLEPHLQDIMATSRDYDELLFAWKGWRDAVGPPIGRLYPTYVNLLNELSRDEGHDDAAADWQSAYETDDLEQEVNDLWQQTKPMYLQLHAYVRRKLAEKYGEDRVSVQRPIPAHLLGNMWAQQWAHIYDIVEPYPGEGTVDVTENMKKQEWDVLRIFHTANNFFKSLSLDAMPQSFWTSSMMTKPTDREVICHASAFDFLKNRDVRIKMCAEVTMEYLYVVHHEMGHCEYYLQYSDQHVFLRRGANPGFHEAVGDTIALSVVTPDYLHTIGLLDNNHVDKERDINYLMKMALEKIAFLPFGLLIDKWRWEAFRGDISPDQYNQRWWQLRNQYQGIEPPVDRSSSDFDPGAKYHVAASVPYIRYFVSFLVQFQFQEALCHAASNYAPLHLCNIYGSREAGAKLRSMLKMGGSRPWPEAMEKLTGSRMMDAGAIKAYFAPLMDWLEEENDGEYIGWGDELTIFHKERN